jgi:hypothetical protein
VVSLEREIGRLYGLPLEEFTGARNELAKRLKNAGEGEAAERIRDLPKPAIAAWAVNQLARSEKKEIAALLRAGGRLREAQARALERRAGDALRKAQREENEIVERLIERAKHILGQGSRQPSDQTLERIRATLKAAATTEDGREELRAGTLTESLSTMGFDALAGLDFTAPEEAGPAEERRRVKETTQQRRELEKEASRLAATATEAEEEATRAEADAVAARRASDEAAKRAARAEAQLRSAND